MPSGLLPTLPLPVTVTDRLFVSVSVSLQPTPSSRNPMVSKIKHKRV
jgi:hypothetical protein